MRRTRTYVVRSTAVLLSFAALFAMGLAYQVAFAQPPQPPTEAATGPEAIRQQQPGFFVRVDVNHPSRTYADGDAMSLQVVSEVDASSSALYKPEDGKLSKIFPN